MAGYARSGRKCVPAGEGRKEGKGGEGLWCNLQWGGRRIHVYSRLLLHGCLQGGFGAINTSLSFTGRTEEQVIAHKGCDRF